MNTFEMFNILENKKYMGSYKHSRVLTLKSNSHLSKISNS